MADIFGQQDARQLLTNKTIYFMGDSNMRAVYKDMIQLLEKHRLLTESALKARTATSFNMDELTYQSEINNGRNYREERLFARNGLTVKFIFVTRCYNDYVESVFEQMKTSPPDVVVYNSCLWDLSRWGPNGVELFKVNMVRLLKRLKEVLLPSCLFIWTTTLPLSQQIQGAFLIPQVEFLKHTLRFDVMEANSFTSKVVSESGYDVLDTHYHVKWQIHRRAKDGVHWLPHVVRHISNLILTHISLAWNKPLPKRSKSTLLTRTINKQVEVDSEPEVDDSENLNQQHGMNVQSSSSDRQDNQFSFSNQPITQLQHPFPSTSNAPFQFGGSLPPCRANRNENFRTGFNQNRISPPSNSQNNFNFDSRMVYVLEPQNDNNVYPNPFEVRPEFISNVTRHRGTSRGTSRGASRGASRGTSRRKRRFSRNRR